MKRPPIPSDPARDEPVRSPLDWPREAGLGVELAREIRAEARRRHRVRLALATAACAVLAVVLLRPFDPAPTAVTPATVATTKVSAPERRTLPDGSIVDLRSGAAIEVEFVPDLRRIRLTRGEAHFEVAKNPAAPFVVIADGIAIRAVGTAFAVERGSAAVDVVVTEGRITVGRDPDAAASAPAADATPLAAGKRATVALNANAFAAPRVSDVSADELARRLAWRVPRLEFSGAPLSEVIRLFAEHGRARLVADDPALRDLKVSGILRADNTDALLQLLASDHAIEAHHRDGAIILARRRP